MRQAARTLMDILKMLPSSVYFNIVSFGGSHKMLFPKSQPLTDAHRARALVHVGGMTASMGASLSLSLSLSLCVCVCVCVWDHSVV